MQFGGILPGLRNGDKAFLIALLVIGAALLAYAEYRRILYAAIDDRYGDWVRFHTRAGQLPERGRRLQYRLEYSLASFFAYGLSDFFLLLRLLLWDLFVVFALLSPFWHSLVFSDWNPFAAMAVSAAGTGAYTVWKLRKSLGLCRVHAWSAETWRCERCGEFHADAEERLEAKNPGKTALPKTSLPSRRRFSWHEFWENRLQMLVDRLQRELPSSPPPAG
ncbi:MAG TPA: hypothetical protein VFA54_17725 [Bryobacterales bacterium]|jgi:hypothetical protein|nr:hypothetical protein [Bryobacterales bacterium]